MKKRETLEEWELREQELETMGFKGGQGRSNHEVYETAGIFTWIVIAFALTMACAAIAGIVLKLMGA